MDLEKNISLATAAMQYTQDKLSLGASNKVEDAFLSFGKSLLCVVAMRSVDISTPAVGKVPGWLVEVAAKAEATRCGNCGEQAAIAYLHLHSVLNASPIDYMARTNADHAFVVLGRQSGSNLSATSTWGSNAIICDPWDNKVYPASEVKNKMYGGGTFLPEVYHRIDD